MYYYRLTKDGKYVDLYTSDKKVADRNKCTLTTTEEIVMQGDKSGYVLESQYVSPDTRLENLEKEYNECVSQLKEYIVEAQLLADSELVQDIQNEYATIVETYEEQTAEILAEQEEE